MESDYRVYFDGKCPVCVAEKDQLEKADRTQRLAFVDCAAADFSCSAANEAGITQSKLLRAMHIRSREGQWFRGAQAFAEIYDSLKMARAARFWKSPAGGAAYRAFLAFRPLLRRLGAAGLARKLVLNEARIARRS